MTIRLGPIRAIRTCYSTGGLDITAPTGPPRTLCRDGGAAAPKGMTVTVYTKDPAKVTCTDCLEWMHA